MTETETLELKKSLAELKEGLISMSAILNKHGAGELWFGVAPNGQAVGLQATDKTLRDLSQAVGAHIEPKLYPHIGLQKLQGRDCIRVQFEGQDAPYFAYGRAYMRVADEDRQLSGARTCMALALDAERYLRVNADIEDLLALVPAVHVGRALRWTLRVAHAEALSAADQPHALQRAWSQLVTPDTRRALLLRVHAPGDFDPQSVAWLAWREGLPPTCRVSYRDVWDPQLAAGHKRFVVWVGGSSEACRRSMAAMPASIFCLADALAECTCILGGTKPWVKTAS